MDLPLIAPPLRCQHDTTAFYHYFTRPASITRVHCLVLIPIASPKWPSVTIIPIHPHLALPDSFRVLGLPPSAATQIAHHGCLKPSRQRYIRRLTCLTALTYLLLVAIAASPLPRPSDLSSPRSLTISLFVSPQIPDADV